MNLATPRLLIRADVGPSIGVGHIMRCMAIAQQWQKVGGEVVFVTGDLPGTLARRLKRNQFLTFQIQNSKADEADARDTLKIIDAERPGWILLDGYRFDNHYQSQFSNQPAFLVVLDDYRHDGHAWADMVINQNAYGHEIGYDSQGIILAGPDYALLRSEFVENNENRRPTPTKARRILVTFGGSDPDNWTLETLEVLEELNLKRLVIDCALGPSFQGYRSLDEFKKRTQMCVRFHQNVDRMSHLMNRADLAVTGGGITCYELARSGVPAIVVPFVDNQIAIARTMDRLGIMTSIEPTNQSSTKSDFTKKLGRQIKQLIANPQQRLSMSIRGQQLIDGLGSQRIVNGIRGLQFPIRRANADDAVTLLNWRNDPEVRAASFDESPISLEMMTSWLDTKLKNPTCQIWLAEDLIGQPVGQIRFDVAEDSQGSNITIVLDHRYRGLGVGRILIASACRKLFSQTEVKQVRALVKPGNTPSERAFKAAGFRAIEPAIVDSKMALQFVLDRDRFHLTSKKKLKSA
ncbi:MAG: UDP-2,4-diacetamido-2,4,6-trideoxy-beta-L-altropyranose hydrolase [Planctomycetota bacterium]